MTNNNPQSDQMSCNCSPLKFMLVIVVTLLFCTLVAPAARAVDQQTLSLKTTINNIGNGIFDVYDACFGEGKFVVLCNNGQIMVSDDGVTWSRAKTQALMPNLNRIAYGNDVFVACGNNSVIYISDDGITWRTCKSRPQSDYDIVQLVYGEKGFVAIASDGSFFYSVDGETWSMKIRDPEKQWHPRAVAFGNGKYVALGWDDDYYAVVFTSADGNTWAEQRATYAWDVYRALYGNGVFVIDVYDADINQKYYHVSKDGITTERANIPPNWWPEVAVYGDGYFFGLDPYGLSWSEDGRTWQSKSTDYRKSWHTMAVGNGMILAFSSDAWIMKIDTLQFDNRLKSIAIDSGKLHPSFSNNKTEYTVVVPPCKLSLTCTAANPSASIFYRDGKSVTLGNTVNIDVKKNSDLKVYVQTIQKEDKVYLLHIVCDKNRLSVANKNSPLS